MRSSKNNIHSSRLGFPALTVLVLVVLAVFCFINFPASASKTGLRNSNNFDLALIAEAVALNATEVTFNQPVSQYNENFLNFPVYFEENRGQQDKRVKYLTRGGGTETFLTATEAVYVIRDPEIEKQKAVAVYMRLGGANTEANFTPSAELAHRTNYFRDSDPKSWYTEIPNYQSVTAENIYDGVNMVWRGKENGAIQYDFVVQPNADPGVIEWEIEGAEKVSIDAEGGLVIETQAGTLKQSRPFTFQETDDGKSEVASGFVLSELPKTSQSTASIFRVKFELGAYDVSKPLTIDPLTYSTFVGGASLEVSHALALDSTGNTYITGFTFSTDFPTTPGVFDTSQNGQADRFVTKLNPAGTALAYSTYIGGLSYDGDLDVGIAVDPGGNVYLSGNTLSTDYPTTVGAVDTIHNGFDDVYVTKLNPLGSGLVYSTFIGGNRDDRSAAIAVDSSGNAYVTGVTSKSPNVATDYPTTVGAFDTTHNGINDIFVSKLNPAGSALVYSTLIGGSEADQGYGIAIDASGNAYVTGFAGPSDYPTTVGAYDTTFNGDLDVVVTKLNAAGSALVYSTFIGGTVTDIGNAIAIDANGSAYVTGSTGNTLSTPYPTTLGAFDTTLNGNADVIVTKLNAAGSALVYSTLIGGSGSEVGRDIFFGPTGSVYLTGHTFNHTIDYPVTPGAYDTTPNGAFGDVDAFITKLNPSGSNLDYSSFIGGAAQDIGFGIVIDQQGVVYLTGSTTQTANAATNFPTTPGAADTTHNGDQDAFVTKLVLTLSATRADFDGDGRTDVSVFRSSEGNWYLNQSTAGFGVVKWGISGDTIVPGDYDGDTKADIAVFRPNSNPANADYFILNSNGFTVSFGSWGVPGDLPVAGDYDGDSKVDLAVFRPSEANWYVLNSSNGSGTVSVFGLNGDLPLAFDLENDGKTNLAVFRPSTNIWYIARNTGIPGQNFEAIQFGLGGDRLVPADYDGDNRDDFAVFRPSTGQWFVRRSSDSTVTVTPFGVSTDIPVPGDYDGDGRDDIAIYRNGQWWLSRSTAGLAVVNFGLAGDKPIPSAAVP